MNKEAKAVVRKAFGRMGDVSFALEGAFGQAYMEYGDDTTDVPEALAEVGRRTGFDVFNVGPLIEREMKLAPEIPCTQNQLILATQLQGYMSGSRARPDSDAGWTSAVHMKMCCNSTCRELSRIAILAERLTPEAVEKSYGSFVRNCLEDQDASDNKSDNKKEE